MKNFFTTLTLIIAVYALIGVICSFEFVEAIKQGYYKDVIKSAVVMVFFTLIVDNLRYYRPAKG